MQLLRKLDLMRMVLGILIVVDGYPLIFFFKETLRLAPGSTVFTALFLAMGFVLMIPITFLRRLYRPNVPLFWLCVAFVFMSIFYMYVYTGDPFAPKGTDMMYYAFIFIFLLLLINVPNDVIEVFIPTVIAFTVVSNLALVYALITDPTWVVGQRAAIQFGAEDDRMGNPHVFSRNALMCVIACGIWMSRPNTSLLVRILSMLSVVFSAGILVMTQTRSSIVALILVVLAFLFFNVRPAQIRQAARGLLRPGSLITIGLLFFAVSFFIQRYNDVYSIVYGYFVAFIERNIENVYALLGMKASGAGYQASLDASAANRSVSFTFLRNVLMGHQHVLLVGYGYKFQYLDVPLVEALLNHGLLGGFGFYLAFNLILAYHCLNAMQFNYNPVSTFLAYFFIYLFVQQFTNGRPYEISFWHPFCLMIRFMGVEHLTAPRLQNRFAVI